MTTTRSDLAPYACDPQNSKGRPFYQEGSSYRAIYQRDHDRIIHARAFRKLQHKTQVFVSHEGDFHRTRLTHSLEVAQVTRTICRALRLNEDLGVTIALAHDLGHPPFGHTGEDALNACLANQGADPFDHNFQALRIVNVLESPYPAHSGLNLTWETLDGLAKHNGPVTDAKKQAAIFDLLPDFPFPLNQQACLEAQVANLCDDIAYNCHDMDDGVRAGLFTLDDLCNIPQLATWIDQFRKDHPQAPFEQEVYNLHRLMITEMINDLIEETRTNLVLKSIKGIDDVRSRESIAGFSKTLLDWLQPLRKFLFERMYRHPEIKKHRVAMASVVTDLFDAFLKEPEKLPADWYKNFISNPNSDAKLTILIDYLSGMTDRFALQAHARLKTLQG